MPFPEGGLVYDYRLDDGGVSKTGEEEEEEEQKKTKASSVHKTDEMHGFLTLHVDTYSHVYVTLS